MRIPPTYEADFEKAVLTFRHQRVYDPTTQQLVPLTPIPESARSEDAAMDFLGPMLPHEAAQAIAEGDMDPITMERFPTAAAPTPPVIRNGGQLNQARTFNPRTNPTSTTRPSFFQGETLLQQRPAQPKATQHHPFAAPHHQARKFPVSFARKAESVSTTLPSATAKQDDPSSSNNNSSPPVISRYFAAQPKTASPLDEVEKSASASLASSSSFESQDPLEVDVAKSISFSPVEEKKQIHTTHITTTKKEGGKENLTPPRESVPVVKENAFSRMMRAGSLVQKQSLKRKATSSFQSRHGKHKAGLFMTHQRTSTIVQQMQQFAHVAPPRKSEAPSSYPSPPSSSTSSISSGVDAPASSLKREEPDSSQVEAECDAVAGEPESSQRAVVVVRGSYLSGVKQSTKANEGDNQQSNNTKTPPQPSSILSSLDRFRFKK